MELVLESLACERRYGSVSLDVDRTDCAAVKLYRSLGFTESGYSDPFHPELLFLNLRL